MIRFAGLFALCLTLSAATARAEVITLKFEGVVESVVDASASGLPTIDFTPIPAGSSLAGTFTYDTNSPLTNGDTGFKRYTELLSKDASVTVNGHRFDSAGPGFAIVVSQEANFSYTGVAMGTQPVSLPAGWSVANPNFPYFTIRFEDATPQTRSLDLPASAADFPTDNMVFVLDFQQSVTVDGVPYGGRVFVQGSLSSLTVKNPLRDIAIDVDPSSTANKLNLTSKKPKPLDVAVFGSSIFQVADVVPDTIGLGDPLLTDPATGAGLKSSPTSNPRRPRRRRPPRPAADLRPARSAARRRHRRLVDDAGVRGPAGKWACRLRPRRRPDPRRSRQGPREEVTSLPDAPSGSLS